MTTVKNTFELIGQRHLTIKYYNKKFCFFPSLRLSVFDFLQFSRILSWQHWFWAEPPLEGNFRPKSRLKQMYPVAIYKSLKSRHREGFNQKPSRMLRKVAHLWVSLHQVGSTLFPRTVMTSQTSILSPRWGTGLARQSHFRSVSPYLFYKGEIDGQALLGIWQQDRKTCAQYLTASS